MAKLLVYLDDERHADLKELAHRHKTTMADLIRFAMEEAFEDDLDAIRGERRLEEHLRDPAGSMTLDEFLKERGLALPDRHVKGGPPRSKAATR
jgi:hypothetical protein